MYQALKDAYGAGLSTVQRSTFIVYRYVRYILRAVLGNAILAIFIWDQFWAHSAKVEATQHAVA